MQYTGPLSERQKDQLHQFKVNIQDIIKSEYDDEFLLRWIRAREWDIRKAEQMLRNSLEWRKKFGADNLLDSWKPPEIFLKYLPCGYFGYDKEGRPVWYEMLGRLDLRGFSYPAFRKDFIKYRVYLAEAFLARKFPECSKQVGKKVDKITILADLEGMSLKLALKPAIDCYLELFSVLEDNYPEGLGQSLIINGPSFVPVLYNIAKPLMSEHSRGKLVFFGKNWKRDILEYIDADQLPVHWGGTRTDPDGDPYCKSQICLGGQIPESYYLNLSDDVDLSQYTTMSVNRAASTQLEFQVEESGSILSWSFWTNHRDIAFGVYRRTANERQKKDEMEEIVGNCRVNSHIVPESGNVVCEKTGTYVVRFDNTYSWVNAKKVSYLIQVLTPDKELQTDF